MTDAPIDAADRTVQVWDPLVRIFHWSLVAAFTVAYLTGEGGEGSEAGEGGTSLADVHVYAGYVIAGLIAFRILWGFVGTRHARFSDLVHGPITVIGHLIDLMLLRARRTLGHSPAAGAMVIALLVMLAVTAGSGYALTPPGYGEGGPFKEIHEVSANATLVLVGLHIAGVLFSSFAHGENLIRAMVTGRKRERLHDHD